MGDFKPPNVEKLNAKKEIKPLIEPWIVEIKSIQKQVDRRAKPGLILCVLSLFIGILFYGVLSFFIDFSEDLIFCSLAILIPLFGLGLIFIHNSNIGKKSGGQKLAKDIIETCRDKQLSVEMILDALTEQTRSGVMLEALGFIGMPAVKPLIAALKDKNASTRSDAAKALGKIGDGRAVVPLISALETTEPTVQGSVVRALQKLAENPNLEKSLRDKASAAAGLDDQELKKLRKAAERQPNKKARTVNRLLTVITGHSMQKIEAIEGQTRRRYSHIIIVGQTTATSSTYKSTEMALIEEIIAEIDFSGRVNTFNSDNLTDPTHEGSVSGYLMTLRMRLGLAPVKRYEVEFCEKNGISFMIAYM